ncbi:MAG: class I SAM-dependent methyltransferase [Dehalococcoidia bacterium]
MSLSLDEFYDDYPRIEPAFQAALDESLNPRGPGLLYEIAGGLGLPPQAIALDLGCGEGKHSLELARRFGFAVHGIDPVLRHIELASQALNSAAKEDPELRRLVRFELGAAEALPLPDATVDLIWCRDVLVHVEVLNAAFAECRRVLRGGGRMLVYNAFATDRLEPREAEWLLTTMRVVPSSADPRHFESAVSAAGLRVDERIDLAGDWEERAEEEGGRGGRRLLHAARLLRDPDRYIARFGRAAYDIMLGDCLWHVYGMIGKLTASVYLLTAAER